MVSRLVVLLVVALLLVPAGPSPAAEHRERLGRPSTSIVLLAQPTSQPTNEPQRAEDEISLGGLLAALGLAALIGACGGLIYAGILGPRKK